MTYCAEIYFITVHEVLAQLKHFKICSNRLFDLSILASTTKRCPIIVIFFRISPQKKARNPRSEHEAEVIINPNVACAGPVSKKKQRCKVRDLTISTFWATL